MISLVPLADIDDYGGPKPSLDCLSADKHEMADCGSHKGSSHCLDRELCVQACVAMQLCMTECM